MARYEFPPYVPAAQRRARAAREVAKRTKKGIAVDRDLRPALADLRRDALEELAGDGGGQ